MNARNNVSMPRDSIGGEIQSRKCDGKFENNVNLNEVFDKHDQAPVAQRADNSIQWISHYPAVKMHSNQHIASFPLDKDIRSL